MPLRAHNFLLDHLPEADLAALLPRFETIELPLRMELEAPGERVEHAYFLTRGIASRVAVAEADRLETGIIGREGMTGLPIFLGTGSSPQRVFVQAEGQGLRLTASELEEAVSEFPSLTGVLLKWTHICLVQATQTALVNARLTIEQRLARWLLMCQDRLDSRFISITHEFLSLMLGVQRPGVTLAMHTLEGMQMIRNDRGRVMIEDRAP